MTNRTFSDTPGDWDVAKAAARTGEGRTELNPKAKPQDLPGEFHSGAGFTGERNWKGYD